MRHSSAPARPISRVAETARPPASAARVRIPQLRPLRGLSIAERHEAEPFVCQASCAENADADSTVRVRVGPLEVVVMLCRLCAAKLPARLRAVPIKEPR